MAFPDLHSFLTLLEERGELLRIGAPVSSDLEITEIADRLVKSGGPAVLFEKVRLPDGAPVAFPVVIGLMGTRERTALALGVSDLNELAVPRPCPDRPQGQRRSGRAAVQPAQAEGRVSPAAAPGSPGGGAGSRLARRRGRPDPLAGAQMLAARRRALCHAAAGDHQRPRNRRAQHGHVPHAGHGQKRHRNALAAPQDRHQPP